MGVKQSPPREKERDCWKWEPALSTNSVPTRCQLSANMRLRGAFGALPAVLVLMVHETLAEDLFTPSKCVSTIVSCCNPDQPVGQHPFRCLMRISLSTPGIINPPSAGDSFEKHKKTRSSLSSVPRCFEVNECAGLYWEGTNACSDRTVARAIAALGPNEIETRVAHVDDNKVEIEFELRPVRRQQEKLNEVDFQHQRRPKPKKKSNNARRRPNR